MFLFVLSRVVPRRSSFPPLVRMLPCLLLVSTRRNTSQSLISSPMLVALPTALHHLQRYYEPTDILSSNFHVGLPYEALTVSCLFIL